MEARRAQSGARPLARRAPTCANVAVAATRQRCHPCLRAPPAWAGRVFVCPVTARPSRHRLPPNPRPGCPCRRDRPGVRLAAGTRSLLSADLIRFRVLCCCAGLAGWRPWGTRPDRLALVSRRITSRRHADSPTYHHHLLLMARAPQTDARLADARLATASRGCQPGGFRHRRRAAAVSPRRAPRTKRVVRREHKGSPASAASTTRSAGSKGASSKRCIIGVVLARAARAGVPCRPCVEHGLEAPWKGGQRTPSPGLRAFLRSARRQSLASGSSRPCRREMSLCPGRPVGSARSKARAHAPPSCCSGLGLEAAVIGAVSNPTFPRPAPSGMALSRL